jgi:hypothetical protein
VTSDWRRTAALLGLRVPIWKAHALDYLERVGQVFCVDFGTDNAVEKARAHWRNRKARKQRAK